MALQKGNHSPDTALLLSDTTPCEVINFVPISHQFQCTFMSISQYKIKFKHIFCLLRADLYMHLYITIENCQKKIKTFAL